MEKFPLKTPETQGHQWKCSVWGVSEWKLTPHRQSIKRSMHRQKHFTRQNYTNSDLHKHKNYIYHFRSVNDVQWQLLDCPSALFFCCRQCLQQSSYISPLTPICLTLTHITIDIIFSFKNLCARVSLSACVRVPSLCGSVRSEVRAVSAHMVTGLLHFIARILTAPSGSVATLERTSTHLAEP